MTLAPTLSEQRVLLCAASATDAATARRVLRRAGFDAQPFPTLSALVADMAQGAGTIVLAEDALHDPAAATLQRMLGGQQPWSDLPVLVLAAPGRAAQAIAGTADPSANVTVIERPMHAASFVSVVRSALRARRRQYDLRATLQGLHEADQRKTEFLATLAHELRNPLAPLLTSITLLTRETPTSGEAARRYATMRRQINHLIRLVDDLTEVSRLTRGRIALDLNAVALQRVLRDALDLSRPLLDKSLHLVDLQLPDEPIWLHGDSVRLAQAFGNLLHNAAKYTPRPGHIQLVARREGQQAVVEVCDDGIGLAPDMQDAIFEMFVQAGGPAKAAQGGLGIGLTLVRSLVELHGGTVAAHSSGLGKGAQFVVRLPVLESAVSTGEQPPPPSTLPQPPALPEPAVALVVDDNHDAADTLAEFLQTLGFSVLVAYSGQEALATLTAQAGPHPALAVLDIGMPEMDGCELAQRIRQQAALADMVLVALTGWGQARDRERTRAAGFNYHLVKPLDVDRLMSIVQLHQSA